MICKYYLTLGSEASDIKSPQCIEVSSMISNLGDVEVSHTRVGLGGIIRKIGSSMDFVGEARDRLVEMFVTDGLHSSAAFAVYRIENDWTFAKFFECPLDFSTFHYDENTASCSCLDSSAAAVIKAKKSVRYEFPVEEMRETRPLNYDGLRILNDTSYQVIGAEVEGQTYTHMDFDKSVWWWYPRLGVTDSNLINNASIVISDQEEFIQKDGQDCGWGFPAMNCTTSYFAECVTDCVVTVDLSTFYIKDSSHLGFVLAKISEGRIIPLTCGYSNLLALDSNTKTDSVKWSGRLTAGEKLTYAVFNHDRIYGRGSGSFTIYPNDGIMKWYERSSAVDIDVVTPLRLLDGILRSMSEGGERIYGGISTTFKEYSEASAAYVEKENARLAGTMLAASDSIRNVPGAKMTTSFSDFCKFMETCFGYVYEIQWRPKSGGGIPEQIVAESIGFSGFTNLDINITSVESPNTVIHFSTAAKSFIGVVYESSMKDRAARFPGSERYQMYEHKHGYRVHTDRYFHDETDDVYYTASVTKKTDPTIVDAWYWQAELTEITVENVDKNTYAATQPFGSAISDYDADAGAFTGTFDASCVRYVRRKKHFVYEDSGNFYSSFPGSSQYNLSDMARKDMLYESAGQTYVILGTSLTKCTTVEGEQEFAPYVYFVHRDDLFTSKGVHPVDRVSEFRYEVSDRIYSQIEIGYAKQDYDIGNNGADEFNFSIVYTADQKLTDSKISLISPYRADCYGIEELAEKRGKETSSTGSDGKIFAVFCTSDSTAYRPDRTLPVTGVSTETMFNGQLSPMHCVEANGRYIASFAPQLRFASTEGNSSAVIGERKISSDMALENPLFGHGDITFSSDSYALPDNWNGYEVRIEAGGRTYTGYLQSLDLAASESEILKYKLIESK